MAETPAIKRAGVQLLSLVIPIFDEEATLAELVRRCVATCDALGCRYEIILVDDGSRDRSAARIEASVAASPGRVIGVFLKQNCGQHTAVLVGLEESRGDIVVTLDADLQNPPEEIRALWPRVLDGYDVVAGVRTPRRDGLLRRLASHGMNWLVRRTGGADLHDYGCMLRAYRREVVDALLNAPASGVFVPVLASRLARLSAEVSVRHAPRPEGRSRYGLARLIRLQADLIWSLARAPSVGTHDGARAQRRDLVRAVVGREARPVSRDELRA